MSKQNVSDTPDNQSARDSENEMTEQEIQQVQSAVLDGSIEVPSGAEDIVEAFRAALAERDEINERFLRLGADFQNFQRRAVNNEREARQGATVGVVQSVLPVMDHFELALEQDHASATAEQILGGVQIIRDELERVLSSFGVVRIAPAAGDAFSPSEHEAMLQQPSTEVEPGHIVQTLSSGYRLGERVIRPAKVIISKIDEE